MTLRCTKSFAGRLSSWASRENVWKHTIITHSTLFFKISCNTKSYLLTLIIN